MVLKGEKHFPFGKGLCFPCLKPLSWKVISHSLPNMESSFQESGFHETNKA
jgi:hypothetical protein